ncbi:metalloprotease family protein [Listeria fleischmannii]|uniref:metalloprotease family protein n=1 Tax=Listeria fleischmannii TaxID=1069827 RepID=UPI001629A98C|nr:metalloprotease family protein [Listeria fleischmannii]MBC1417907.1 hypothetical protein [Listeria fleischmannii]
MKANKHLLSAISKYVLKSIKLFNWIIIFFIAILIVLALLFNSVAVLIFTIYWLCLYVFGVLCSFIMHEYIHAYFLNKYNIKFKISYDLFRFSIIPQDKMTKKQMIITAISAPTIVCGVGLLMLTFNTLINVSLLKFVSVIFITHIISLLPFMGDGKTILKALIIK